MNTDETPRRFTIAVQGVPGIEFVIAATDDAKLVRREKSTLLFSR